MPLATASVAMLSLMCAVAPLLPFSYWFGARGDYYVAGLIMVLVAGPAGNLSGLYGLKRAAAARARRRKVGWLVPRIVGWWFLGVVLAYLVAGIPVILAEQFRGTVGSLAINTLMIAGACCWIATPLGALFGLAWQGLRRAK
jgi:hypothetical protein